MTTYKLGDRWNTSIPPPPPQGTPPEPPLDSRPLCGHGIPETWKQVNILNFSLSETLVWRRMLRIRGAFACFFVVLWQFQV